jgi:hypothetical protein
VAQPAYAAQAGGRRDLQGQRQVLVAARSVLLQRIEQAQVQIVCDEIFHLNNILAIKRRFP